MRLHGRVATPHEQEALDRRPPIDPQVAIVVDAIHDLAGDKHIGFGASGLIPFASWLAWAREYGLDWYARRLLWPIVQQVDRLRFNAQAAATKE